MTNTTEQMEMKCNADVVEDAQRGEKAYILECSRNSVRGDDVWAFADNAATVELNPAFSGLVNTGHQIEHGRFASAIWANEPDEFVRGYRQIEIGDSGQPTEADCASAHRQQAHAALRFIQAGRRKLKR